MNELGSQAWSRFDSKTVRRFQWSNQAVEVARRVWNCGNAGNKTDVSRWDLSPNLQARFSKLYPADFVGWNWVFQVNSWFPKFKISHQESRGGHLNSTGMNATFLRETAWSWNAMHYVVTSKMDPSYMVLARSFPTFFHNTPPQHGLFLSAAPEFLERSSDFSKRPQS